MSRSSRDDGVNRRHFLKIAGLAVLGGAVGLTRPLSGDALAAGLKAVPETAVAAVGRQLVLHNTHTGETGHCMFAARGGYLAEGLAKANRLLRDHRTGDVHRIDPELLDLLHDLAGTLDVEPEFEIISGYRSPATNALLQRRSKGVASRSYHMQGKAVDVRLRGVELKRLHRAALGLRRGGVGLYSASRFVHIDTGPVRTW